MRFPKFRTLWGFLFILLSVAALFLSTLVLMLSEYQSESRDLQDLATFAPMMVVVLGGSTATLFFFYGAAFLLRRGKP